MSDLIPNDSMDTNRDDAVKSNVKISEFTIKNRFENIKRTRLISRWQVEEFEKLFGENIITSQIPLNNFTEDASYIGLEEVLEILNSKVSEFVKTDLGDTDYILKQCYDLKGLIKDMRQIISVIDSDFIVNYLKDESKAYVINRFEHKDIVYDNDNPKIIDIRELDVETAFKCYPIWSQAIFTPREFFYNDIGETDYNDKAKPSHYSLISNYLPLLSIFYKFCVVDRDDPEIYGGDLVELVKPEIYTKNLIVKDLIGIFENIKKTDVFFNVLEYWIDSIIKGSQNLDYADHNLYNARNNYHYDLTKFYGYLKIIVPIFKNELCLDILNGLKKVY